jgi:aminoglycoside phosphotransferase family enzyme/predicted kinase
VSREPAVDVTASDLSQQDVIACLAAPAAYGRQCRRVDRVDTHISVVFLAGDRAFKLKRAVHFPYVDYSTLERRKECCEKEVRLNRRTAPDLYLGVAPVVRSGAGELRVGGTGVAVEWLVEMRRFEQDWLLDAVARRGELDVDLAAAIGTAAARLHAEAAPRRDCGGASAMQWVVDENDAELSAAGAAVAQSTRARLHEASVAALGRHGGLLDARRERGWVRECHGDLHLGNIFLAGDRPVLFDCIEFNDELSCIDVLYDAAFLVMDLLHRQLPAHANAALNAWLDRLPQYDALPLLPLFLSCRAAIRAKVSMAASALVEDPARAARARRDANAYLDRALSVIRPGAGAIVAIGGLSGAGKSTLARRLAPGLGRGPGAIVLRSDVARKRRFGAEPTERLPDSAYSAPVTAAVYEELAQSAREVARAGYVALVDAVFATDALREAIRSAAVSEGAPFVGLWLDAPLDILDARLRARRADASDVTPAVLRQQHARATAPADWGRIDASCSLDRVADTALGRITDRIEATRNVNQSIN